MNLQYIDLPDSEITFSFQHLESIVSDAQEEKLY